MAPAGVAYRRRVGDEADRVGPGQLRPQQVALAVVVADDDRLAGGYPAGHERHDQRQELRVRGVEAGLVHVPDAAVGCSCPHPCAPDFANCSDEHRQQLHQPGRERRG